jgi:prolyl-tRNA editing enzyme YbaK/EbsC (Cys-tRNA(Pro) deacylase)
VVHELASDVPPGEREDRPNDSDECSSTFEKIVSHLDQHGVPYRTVHHEPTRTSAASAEARGEELAVGGKAIVLKVDDVFGLFVLSASLKLDSSAIRKRLGARKVRFASGEELVKLTGLAPGAVPPFGRPILELDLYIDESIARNDRIAFNAGSLTDSVAMNASDYVRIAGGAVFSFSK